VVEDPFPGAVQRPAAEPVVHRLPLPVAGGHVRPGSTGPFPPQNPVDSLPMVRPPATTTTRLGQQRLNPRLRPVRHLTRPIMNRGDYPPHKIHEKRPRGMCGVPMRSEGA
jgi:hypothetical protein